MIGIEQTLIEICTDPLHGDGYQFWSGIGLTIFLPLVFWWHHICIEKGCYRWGHADPEHGHPVCKKHNEHPDLKRFT